mmetsp:Transcript_3537/g.6420  ORF Transcript_3537/g.6420 Transcript_3537/m.6420 type:complete len:123 (+) Transcript_3537:246-614(+)
MARMHFLMAQQSWPIQLKCNAESVDDYHLSSVITNQRNQQTLKDCSHFGKRKETTIGKICCTPQLMRKWLLPSPLWPWIGDLYASMFAFQSASSSNQVASFNCSQDVRLEYNNLACFSAALS